MWLRASAAVIVIAAASIAVALWWRVAFPFHDTIVGQLPEETVGYMHVNLTPRLRRDVRSVIARFRSELGTPFADALHAAVGSPEVREIAFAISRTPDDVIRGALIIGQRPSRRPDVVARMDVVSTPVLIRTYVLRVGAGAPRTDALDRALARHRHRPVQMVVRPRALASHVAVLAAAASLFPDIAAASGTFDRTGLILRANVRQSFLDPLRRSIIGQPLFGPLDSGVVQALRVPGGAIAATLDVTIPGVSLRAFRSVVPELVDLRMARDGAAVRFHPRVEPSHGFGQMIARAIASLLWPSVRRGEIDGLPTTRAIADPDSFVMEREYANGWIVRRTESEEVVMRGRGLQGGTMIAEIGRSLRGEPIVSSDLSASFISIRLPMQCSGDVSSAFLVLHRISPQVVGSLAVDPGGSDWSICGLLSKN